MIITITMDRDVHAACNMIEYYNVYKTLNPTHVGSMSKFNPTCVGSMSKFNPTCVGSMSKFNPTCVRSMPRGMITYKSYKNCLEQEALRSLASE